MGQNGHVKSFRIQEKRDRDDFEFIGLCQSRHDMCVSSPGFLPPSVSEKAFGLSNLSTFHQAQETRGCPVQC